MSPHIIELAVSSCFGFGSGEINEGFVCDPSLLDIFRTCSFLWFRFLVFAGVFFRTGLFFRVDPHQPYPTPHQPRPLLAFVVLLVSKRGYFETAASNARRMLPFGPCISIQSSML